MSTFSFSKPAAAARILIPISVSGLTALCLGFDMGMMSGSIIPIAHNFHLNRWEKGILVGCLNLIAAVATLFGSWAADRWGRMLAIKVTVFLLLLGPLIAATSERYSTLLLGRLIIGIGGGLALVTAPVYAAELAPPRHRGAIVSSIEIATNGGTLLGYLAAMIVTIPHVGKDVGWRIATMLAAVPAALALMQMGLLVESPRWLLQNDRRSEAVQVLGYLLKEKSTEDLQELVKQMEEDIRTEQHQASWSEVLCPSISVFRMLLAGVGCAFFQVAVGSEALIYNTSQVLKAFGVKAIEDINFATIAVGVVPICAAFMGGVAFDMIGRRACLLASLVLSFFSLGGLWVLLVLKVRQAAVSVIFLCVICFAVDMGLAPGKLVIGTESYPVAIRAKGLALGLFVNRLLSGLMTLGFPVLWQYMGLSGLLGCFTVTAFVGILWAWYCVPEGVGLNLEEVSRLYHQPVMKSRHSKDTGGSPDMSAAVLRVKSV